MLSRLWQFIKYWYFRYLVVTELYMVEYWERLTIHTIFAVVFMGLWYFNYAVVLYVVSRLGSPKRPRDLSIMHINPTAS